jgi:hypothetical protein
LVIYTLVPICAFAGVFLYLDRWRVGVRRRNAQAWDTLAAQLRPNRDTSGELSLPFVWSDAQAGGNAVQDATPEEQWQCIQGAQGLWAMYENARVMIDMADYATRNSGDVDRELLAALRNDAMQIRFYVLMALAKYACAQVNESTCVNVSRAAAMYAGLAARTAELLQAQGGQMVPNFVASM